jgi:hypothetical protein
MANVKTLSILYRYLKKYRQDMRFCKNIYYLRIRFQVIHSVFHGPSQKEMAASPGFEPGAEL